jgi:hypothetical protein
MPDAPSPHAALASASAGASLVAAARRLAVTMTSDAGDWRTDVDVRALERAVTAFVVAERTTAAQVAAVVRAALRADDATPPLAVAIAVVVHLAETTARDALGEA